MKNKFLVFASALLLLSFSAVKSAKAQDYYSAVGVSLGYPLGFEFKQFFSSKAAISASLGYTPRADIMLINATYQYHIPLYDNLSFYAGAGLSVGTAFSKATLSGNKFVIGLTPNIGVEYKLPTSPLVFALDYKPMISFTSHSQFNQSAIKVLYTF